MSYCPNGSFFVLPLYFQGSNLTQIHQDLYIYRNQLLGHVSDLFFSKLLEIKSDNVLCTFTELIHMHTAQYCIVSFITMTIVFCSQSDAQNGNSAEKTSSGPMHQGQRPRMEVKIPGCWFYRLPHKVPSLGSNTYNPPSPFCQILPAIYFRT